MKLTGIIEQAFRGQVLFRGFATLFNLARISKGTEYQRDVDSDRLNEITDYFISSQYMFFPELIFGWYINDNTIQRYLNDLSVSTFQTVEGIKFKKARYTLPETNYILGDNPTTKTFTIEIPERIVALKLFNRIDGNHRLSAIDQIISDNSNDEIGNKIVPYSVLLQFATEEPHSEIDAKRYETAYFHLINSKAKPLTTEENLKSILTEGLFSQIEKQELLSLDEAQIQYIENLGRTISENSIDFLNKVFNKDYYSYSVSLIQGFIQQGEFYEDGKSKEIINAVKYINSVYVTKRVKEPTKDILLALTVVYLKENTVFEKFLDWVNKNEVGNIHELFFENIIDLFNNIHKQRSYKVFVAMPYISFKRVNEYNILFREVLSDISKKTGFGLELIPIMRFRGESQRIDHRLIEKIKECDIFIGDLTTVNNNVIFEIGLAEGNNKKILLIRSEEDTARLPFDEATKLDKGKLIPFDLDKLQYIPYSNSGYYNDIKSIMRNNLPVILEQLKKEG